MEFHTKTNNMQVDYIIYLEPQLSNKFIDCCNEIIQNFHDEIKSSIQIIFQPHCSITGFFTIEVDPCRLPIMEKDMKHCFEAFVDDLTDVYDHSSVSITSKLTCESEQQLSSSIKCIKHIRNIDLKPITSACFTIKRQLSARLLAALNNKNKYISVAEERGHAQRPLEEIERLNFFLNYVKIGHDYSLYIPMIINSLRPNDLISLGENLIKCMSKSRGRFVRVQDKFGIRIKLADHMSILNRPKIDSPEQLRILFNCAKKIDQKFSDLKDLYWDLVFYRETKSLNSLPQKARNFHEVFRKPNFTFSNLNTSFSSCLKNLSDHVELTQKVGVLVHE